MIGFSFCDRYANLTDKIAAFTGAGENVYSGSIGYGQLSMQDSFIADQMPAEVASLILSS